MVGTTTVQMVSGLFADRESANEAYRAVLARGYTNDEVNIAMSEETRQAYEASGGRPDEIANESADRAFQGSGVGGAIGSVAGGIIGAIAAIGSNLVLPGLGLVIAGPLAAGLAGAGAGGLAGGLVGALSGLGVPDDHVKDYEGRIRGGATMVAVSARSSEDARAIESSWRALGAQRVDRY